MEQIVSVLLGRFQQRSGAHVGRLERAQWQVGGTLVSYLPNVGSHIAILRKLQTSPQALHRVKKLLFVTRHAPTALPGLIKTALGNSEEKMLKRLSVKVWGPAELEKYLCQVPPLCLRYRPDLSPRRAERLARIERNRRLYDEEFAKLHGEIQFIGMSVYKEEASAGVEMEKIYIPLRVIPEGASGESEKSQQTDPISLLHPGSRHVILGDPGSGKTTLLRFLALAGSKRQLLERYGTPKDDRLPILVVLRRYAEALRAKPDLDLLDYVVEVSRKDFNGSEIDREFFEYYLYAGQGLLFFDGIDELPNPEFKTVVRQQVGDLLDTYPGNAVLITSRIVGYEKEGRFDSLGFSHHHLARLSLEDIEAFVGDWYRARISSKAERERHAKDLVRILRDSDSRAIRELAENPLLLTIICLVHRIDAELPDERVVLYQKCTETLLNTWHNWKYQQENIASRNKVERRNRSRMEAIAHWMQGLSQGEEIGRAVVPYDELLGLLTTYIKDIEKPRDEDARQLAEVFLRFVKQQAGLLIEVGSGQYSFVHLTFQEYLTATYLRKSGEAAGMEAIWPFLKDHCSDPRWHEVIRLLLGSLERAESQRVLLEKILPRKQGAGAFERVLVCGGCLLDGVDAAEELRDEILSGLLFQAASAKDLDRMRRTLRMLRGWEERDPSHRGLLLQLARQTVLLAKLGLLELNLALCLVALGWEDQDVAAVTGWLMDPSSREGQIYAICCTGAIGAGPLLSGREQEFLQTSLVVTSLTSSDLNFAAAALAPLLQPTNDLSSSLFLLLASVLAPSGPFADLCYNYLGINQAGYSVTRDRTRDRARALDRSLARALDRVLAQDRDRDWATRALNHALDRALELDPDRARALDRTRQLAIDREQDRVLALAGRRFVPLWPTVLAEEAIHGPILDLLCDLLALEPRPHWWEVLRMRALPRVPERATLVNPQVWSATFEAFADGKFTSSTCESAAAQLLLDIGMWCNGFFEHPQESPFMPLARLTCKINSAPLRVAHCLRDLAYGDASRLKDLIAMIGSEDPAYRRLFEGAFWCDRKPEPPKRRRGSSRR